jgi:hypothetical protein
VMLDIAVCGLGLFMFFLLLFCSLLRPPRAIPARTSSSFVLLFSFPLLSFARVSASISDFFFPPIPVRGGRPSPRYYAATVAHLSHLLLPRHRLFPFFSPSPHPLHSSRSPRRNPPQPPRDRAGLAGVELVARESTGRAPFPFLLQGLLCSVSSPGQYSNISLYIFFTGVGLRDTNLIHLFVCRFLQQFWQTWTCFGWQSK